MGMLSQVQLIAALNEFLLDGGCDVSCEHDDSSINMQQCILYAHGPGPGRHWFINAHFDEDGSNAVPSIVMASSTKWVAMSNSEMWKRAATTVRHWFSLAEPECFTKIRDIVLEGSDG